ncbi:MAG: response regulator, partial [Bacteroidales bacterium]|nr:response regulator [Bacteroidales bacterium]
MPRKVVIVVFLLIAQLVSAQKKQIRFQHYTTDDGLSQNMIDCMLKDHKGFMWFGTWNGLNRFDGYNFVCYKQKSDEPYTLSNNFVRSICQDAYHNIWIGTRNGLNLYLYNQDKFLNFFTTNDSVGICSNEINVVYYDSHGYLWVGSAQKGLDRLTLGKNSKVLEIKHFSAGTGDDQISHNSILCIYEDGQQNLWVGTQSGLNRYNYRNNSFVKLFSDPTSLNSLSSNVINTIYEDKYGDLWIGTEYGLNRIHHNNYSIERYYYNPDNPFGLTHNVVRDIVEDLNGNLIVGTLGGISIFDRKNNRFVNYKHTLHNKFGLNNDFVNCLLSDKEGNLWIGTEKGGVNHYNVYQHQFEFFENEMGNPNSLSYNTINSIFEDENFIWIGTAGGGLNIYHKKLQKFYHFRHDVHKPQSISSDFISAIFKDREGNIWIGTWGEGLNMVRKGQELSGSFIHFAADGQPGSLVSTFVSSITEDRLGRLFVGTIGGLSIKDNRTNVFKTFSGKGIVPIDRIGCLQFDIQENLWVGTENGLFQIIPSNQGVIDPQTSSYNLYRNVPGDKYCLSGNYIISICSDKLGRMWFGTYGNGLNLMLPSENAKNIRFISYDERDGLSSNVIYGILPDKEGNLWLSTDNGLTKFNPEKKVAKCYYESDGLLNNQFYWSAYFCNEQGKMYFGGMNGLTAFYPEQIRDDPNPPQIAFTDFKIFNNSTKVGQKYFGKISLPQVISEAHEIVLSYKANEFSIEFSALHYNQPAKNQYQYKLEGFDQNWNTVGANRRFAVYTNLKGGRYTFWVKASNNDGVWNQKPAKITIRIIPPFWSTWWFRGILFIFIIASIIAYNRIKLYTLERQKQKLEKLVEQRTALIEKQKQELYHQAVLLSDTNKELIQRQQLIEGQKAQLEVQNAEIIEQRNRLMELNKKVQLSQKQQLKLFTHISHEFRTPLTLILSPVEQLLTEKLPTHIHNQLQTIYKNAQRLLHLVDQIMELRKIESGKNELQLIESDLIRYLNDIAVSFNSVAQERHINFHTYYQPESLITAFDKDKVENIVYNLLSNAFKYTPENKSILFYTALVDRNIAEKDEILIISPQEKIPECLQYIEIRVVDEGIGISSDQIKDIFKRFYRLNTPYMQKTKGTGIGLYITREMVKELYGYLFVKSKVGEGTTFRILLPLSDFYRKLELPISKIESLPSTSKVSSLHLLHVNDSNDNHELLSSSNATVLLIDDDAELLSFMASFLSQSYKVLTASNGQEGLKLAELYIPDVIICDVMMPEIDGIEVCNNLKSNLTTSHIPVILLSAKAEIENYIEGLENGADDYIAKPFHLPVLAAKVKSFIDNRERLKKLFTEQMYPTAKDMANNKADEKFIEKALHVVKAHIADGDFSVEDFAKEM